MLYSNCVYFMMCHHCVFVFCSVVFSPLVMMLHICLLCANENFLLTLLTYNGITIYNPAVLPTWSFDSFLLVK